MTICWKTMLNPYWLNTYIKVWDDFLGISKLIVWLIECYRQQADIILACVCLFPMFEFIENIHLAVESTNWTYQFEIYIYIFCIIIINYFIYKVDASKCSTSKYSIFHFSKKETYSVNYKGNLSASKCSTLLKTKTKTKTPAT